MYDVVLFDLDGTLTDSGPGIRKSVEYSLNCFGIDVPDIMDLNVFVGPPLLDSYRKYYDFSPEQAKQAVVYYRDYYQKGGMFDNDVYEGVEKLLKTLKEAGKSIILATSKPELYAVQILEHFGLAQYFDCMAGAAMDESRTDKAEVITYALEKAGVSDRSRVVMVGDREYDVLGARKNGLDCIGVLFGYGSREELERAESAYLAETVEDIGSIVLKRSHAE